MSDLYVVLSGGGDRGDVRGGQGGAGAAVPRQTGGEEDVSALPLQPGRELGECEVRDTARAWLCVATLPVVTGGGGEGGEGGDGGGVSLC